MTATDLPGYVVVRRTTRPEAPTPLRTDVAGFAGRSPHGLTGRAVMVHNADELERFFPGVAGRRLGVAVRGYLDNGGQVACVLRLDDASDPAAAYEQVQSLLDAPQVSLLVLPDLWEDLGEAAPELIEQLAAAAHERLDRMLVLDLPREAADTLAALGRLDDLLAEPQARAVAMYHPWIRVEERPGGPGGRLATVPPSGHVAGLISRLDREQGPGRSPANAPLVGVVDVDGTPPPPAEAVLVARRVNPIRCVPGIGLQLWGARTFGRASSGRFIAHRRLLHRLVRAARQAGEALVFENDGPQLRLALAQALRTVLLQAYRSGALAGRTDEQAFSVRCDDTTTLPADSDAGRVVCEIQFTPAFPMELIRVQIGVAAEGRLEVIEL
jgi:uncharacterized protein